MGSFKETFLFILIFLQVKESYVEIQMKSIAVFYEEVSTIGWVFRGASSRQFFIYKTCNQN